MRSFEPPTQNQIVLLKRLQVTNGGMALEEKDFQKLSKQQASGMIDAMIRDRKKGNGKGTQQSSEGSSAESEIIAKPFLFTQNFRGDSGAWQVARMTAEEEEALRKAHREHCKRILKECVDDFPKNLDIAVALFEKRADKFFSWSQAFLEEKVRLSRGNGNGGGKNEQ
jgi:hypothetical protein